MISTTISYSAELLGDRRLAAEFIRNIPADSTSADFLAANPRLNIAGMGILTKQVYDIARPPLDRDPLERTKAARLGALSLLLTDIIDDQIDNPAVPLEEKFRYLDGTGTRPETIWSPAVCSPRWVLLPV